MDVIRWHEHLRRVGLQGRPLMGERDAGEQHGFGYGHGSSCGGGVHSRQAQPQVSSSAALGQKNQQPAGARTIVQIGQEYE